MKKFLIALNIVIWSFVGYQATAKSAWTYKARTANPLLILKPKSQNKTVKKLRYTKNTKALNQKTLRKNNSK